MNPAFKFAIITLCFITFFNVFSESAHAQKIKDLFKKEMPKFSVLPEQEFNDKTQLIKDMPSGDSSLAYQMRIPADWKMANDTYMSNYNINTKILSTVALYYSKPSILAERSKLEINVLKLEYDITAEQWFTQYILKNAYNVEGVEAFSENKVGGLYVYLINGETYVDRILVTINGKNLIIVKYTIPAASWQEYSSLVGQSQNSFKLDSLQEIEIENFKEFRFLDISKFLYPEVWKTAFSPVRNIENIELVLNNLDEKNPKQLNGQIHIYMTASYQVDDLEKEIEETKVKIRKNGLIAGELLESREQTDFNESVEFGFVDVYKATDINNSGIEYEAWISVLAMKNYYYIITLATPGRNADFSMWSRNVNALEAIYKTLEPQIKEIRTDTQDE